MRTRRWFTPDGRRELRQVDVPSEPMGERSYVVSLLSWPEGRVLVEWADDLLQAVPGQTGRVFYLTKWCVLTVHSMEDGRPLRQLLTRNHGAVANPTDEWVLAYGDTLTCIDVGTGATRWTSPGGRLYVVPGWRWLVVRQVGRWSAERGRPPTRFDVLDAATGRVVWGLSQPTPCDHLGLSSDGLHLAVHFVGAPPAAFEVATGRPLTGTEAVTAIAAATTEGLGCADWPPSLAAAPAPS